MLDIVILYEKEYYPIANPTVAELIESFLEEKGMTQKELAREVGISLSRINDYISGRYTRLRISGTGQRANSIATSS